MCILNFKVYAVQIKKIIHRYNMNKIQFSFISNSCYNVKSDLFLSS